ncbi:hypothetical protein I33_2499 [Bacillus subtilis subsp. subtilis str. RO-NN-1]|nr:hypothetical protein I33_2499 [Bacillus subtilis subsp. subtilis str. RO-NN-1]
MIKFVLLLAAAVITCSIGHQISGGLQRPRKRAAKTSLCTQDIQSVKQINCINFYI